MNDTVATIRISEQARLRVEYDQDRNLTSYGDEWEGIVRAYSWSRWGWQLIYGEKVDDEETGGNFGDDFLEDKTLTKSSFNGYSQGESLKIFHNGCSEGILEEFFNVWAGNVYGIILELWNPTPGAGWECAQAGDGSDQVWGIAQEFFGSDEDEVVKYAKDCFGDEMCHEEYMKKELAK